MLVAYQANYRSGFFNKNTALQCLHFLVVRIFFRYFTGGGALQFLRLQKELKVPRKKSGKFLQGVTNFLFE